MQANLRQDAPGFDKHHWPALAAKARAAEAARALRREPGVLKASGATAEHLQIKFPLGLMVVFRSATRAGGLATWLLSVVAVGILLGAIGFVLSQAVRQGDASRRAMALQAEVDWRCRALLLRPQRERCVVLVQERQPWDSAGVRALVHEAGSATVGP